MPMPRIEGVQVLGSGEQVGPLPGGHRAGSEPVRHNVQQEPEVTLTAFAREPVQTRRCIAAPGQRRMQPREVGRKEQIPGTPGRERGGYQKVIEAETGGMVEQRGPIP